MPITYGQVPVRPSFRLGVAVRGYTRRAPLWAAVERTYGGFGSGAFGRQRQVTTVTFSGRGNRHRDGFVGRRHVLTPASSRRLARVIWRSR